jgi:hypothetical protein
VSRSGPEGKPFQIPKQLVWEAYGRVKANKGAAGVDGQSIADFESDLRSSVAVETVRLAYESLSQERNPLARGKSNLPRTDPPAPPTW